MTKADEGDRSAVTCAITEERDGPVVTIRGWAEASAALAGRYRLRVRKTGAAGSSDIAQAGEFRAEPRRPVSVGQAGLGLEQGARYDAVLTLDVLGRTIECRSSGPAATPL
ncbi:hypothetical protein DK419_14595 [Methylobacterium terrae]|uniref:CsgH-like domain-containing protein n=1 Tax=Methylobacterium terrae TaxID=2202827 RepID=A0A2U8WMS2_9HYPH|nr:curli-like amyloid fiber formation chaperone CsgH [Methylobacterium terrae]AWN47393.1 hypothetical protein DK419_14595 [Methylobacterium terrae]